MITFKLSENNKLEKKNYALRFWNSNGQCVAVDRTYILYFDSFVRAYDKAMRLVEKAYRMDCVKMDINNTYWDIINN